MARNMESNLDDVRMTSNAEEIPDCLKSQGLGFAQTVT
jgi:hypothetical protein